LSIDLVFIVQEQIRLLAKETLVYSKTPFKKRRLPLEMDPAAYFLLRNRALVDIKNRNYYNSGSIINHSPASSRSKAR